MVEIFTPEIIVIAVIALAALFLLTFLMLLNIIFSLSRIKKCLLTISEKTLALEEQQTVLRQDRRKVNNAITDFAETEHKIESIERRLDELGRQSTESQNLLAGHESKLKEHDVLLGKAGQMMGKETAGFTQMTQRIRVLEDDFLGLKVFQRSFEQIRNHILNVLGGMPFHMPSQNLPTEHKAFNEETATPMDPKLSNRENFRRSQMPYQ